MQRAEDLVPVSEIFLSIQGEGVWAGTPSVFLRTYRCNLSCTWCDTKYTWLGQEKALPGVEFTPLPAREIEDKVARFGCKHLVLTGGEPLLHQRQVEPLLARLKQQGYFIEVETNGTIVPTAEVTEAVDCFNVSPKLSNSLVNVNARVKRDALRAHVQSNKAWFKFVICAKGDIGEVEEMIAENGIPRERVILMPEGIDALTILERSRWIAEICKARGFRFTPRLHILLYGNKRGV